MMDSNPTVCEEKLTTSNPNRRGRFIEKQSRHYSVSVLLNHDQDCCQFFFTNCQITIHYFLPFCPVD